MDCPLSHFRGCLLGCRKPGSEHSNQHLLSSFPALVAYGMLPRSNSYGLGGHRSIYSAYRQHIWTHHSVAPLDLVLLDSKLLTFTSTCRPPPLATLKHIGHAPALSSTTLRENVLLTSRSSRLSSLLFANASWRVGCAMKDECVLNHLF